MARILLADDGDGIRRVLARGLTNAGHEVDQVADGREALTAVDTNEYDLVITDMIMPEVNGAEVIAALLIKRPNMKVIAISGGDMIEPEVYLQVAMDLGVVSRLLKPFMVDQLVSEVARMLAL